MREENPACYKPGIGFKNSPNEKANVMPTPDQPVPPVTPTRPKYRHCQVCQSPLNDLRCKLCGTQNSASNADDSSTGCFAEPSPPAPAPEVTEADKALAATFARMSENTTGTFAEFVDYLAEEIAAHTRRACASRDAEIERLSENLADELRDRNCFETDIGNLRTRLAAYESGDTVGVEKERSALLAKLNELVLAWKDCPVGEGEVGLKRMNAAVSAVMLIGDCNHAAALRAATPKAEGKAQ